MKLGTDELRFETDGAVATMTINRPEARNAVSPELGDTIEAAIESFEQDDSLRVLIVTGAGDVAFCAGADLKSLIPQVTEGAATDADTMRRNTKRPFSSTTKPVLAAVNGFALAGGTELLLGTDIRVASEHATFGLPEPRWALVPFGGSHVRLPQQVPWARAMEMLLTGDPISADEALAIGLINHVVPHDRLMEKTRSIADRIVQNGPLAIRAIKRAVFEAYNRTWDDAFAIESQISQAVLASEDAKEGPRAFAEKRNPVFTGR